MAFTGSPPKESVTSIPVSDAGLVLLAPFLPELFKQLDITTEHRLPSPAKQWEGTAVLEFLVWGNEAPSNPSYGMIHFLCGLTRDSAPFPIHPLDAEIEEECESLLISVIEHWTALKQISTQSLRLEFLQRAGHLTIADNCILSVETKIADVLLRQIAWNISVVHFPWMQKTLAVDWGNDTVQFTH